MPQRLSSPLITLLTDFGLKDHFVGVMKAVIAVIAPRARVIDITHEIEPYQLSPARFALAQSWPYFPTRTIHVAVVDPGVGTARRPILVEAANHRFIGPDNGIFSDLLDLPGTKVRHIANTKLFLPNVSTTFHGRDIFAPVAAHLAAGVAASRVGPLVTDAIKLPPQRAVRTSERTWTGQIVLVDRFGNLITNLSLAELPDLTRRAFVLQLGSTELSALAPNYASGPSGQAIAVAGSSGYLEIAINQDSAALRLGRGGGAPVQLTLP
jgi:hypothetical protein